MNEEHPPSHIGSQSLISYREDFQVAEGTLRVVGVGAHLLRVIATIGKAS